MKPSPPDITFSALQDAANVYLMEAERSSNNSNFHLRNPRSQVMKLGALVGMLCQSILKWAPLDHHHNHQDSLSFWNQSSLAKSQIENAIGALFFGLFVTAETCAMDLRVCILKKMDLNAKKYPVELCKGKSGKYTQYSSHTGITKSTGQSTLDSPHKSVRNSKNNEASIAETVQDLTRFIRSFAEDREWSKFHTPRSIVCALMGEMGELAELVQWKQEGTATEILSTKEYDNAEQEMADISIYLMRLADVCCVDIGQAAWAQSRSYCSTFEEGQLL